MGLSALCYHRFTYNLVDNYACPTCGNVETLSHYFFECNSHTLAHTKLYDSLTQLGIDITNKPLSLQTILHGTNEYHQNLIDIVFQYLGD